MPNDRLFRAFVQLAGRFDLVVYCYLTLTRPYQALGWINFPDWNWGTALKALPLAASHLANTLIGLVALNLIDIPMFG